MKSKTSFFNKTIFKRDILTLWPLWVAELVGMVLYCVVGLYSKCAYYTQNELTNGSFVVGTMRESASYVMMLLTLSFLSAGVCIVVAVFIFSYLFKSRSAYMIHTFPIGRSSLFFTHYFAGLTIVCVPYLITFFGIWCVNLGFGLNMTSAIFFTALETILQNVFYFGLACLTIMISGNFIMAFLIYGVSNILYGGISSMLSMLKSLFVYGAQGNSMGHLGEGFLGVFTPVVFLQKKMGIESLITDSTINGKAAAETMNFKLPLANLGVFAIYFAVGVAFVLLALFLYKKRPMENVGDTLAFSWCKPVFRTVFCVSGGLAGALGLLYLFFADSFSREFQYGKKFIITLLFTAITCIICYFVAEMILQKGFHVFKSISYVQMTIIVMCTLGALGVLKVRASGANVPALEKIDYVTVRMNENEYVIQDPSRIADFIKVQKDLYKTGKDIVHYEGDSIDYLEVNYSMKDGNKIAREFAYVCGGNLGMDTRIISYFASQKNTKEFLFTRAYNEMNVADASIEQGGEATVTPDSNQQMRKIYAAICKDLDAGTISIVNKNYISGSAAYVYLQINLPVSRALKNKLQKKYGYSANYFNQFNYKSYTLRVTDKAKNTYPLIKKIAGF